MYLLFILKNKNQNMSEEPTQPQMFVFDKYGLDIGDENIDVLTDEVESVVKGMVQTIWNGESLTLGEAITLAEGQKSPAEDNVSVFMQSVETASQQYRLVLGYTAYRKVTTQKPKKRGVDMDALYNKAYVFAYSVTEHKAHCKAWKVIETPISEGKLLNKGLYVGNTCILGWYTSDSASVFEMPKQSSLLEGMHLPAISGDERTYYTGSTKNLFTKYYGIATN